MKRAFCLLFFFQLGMLFAQQQAPSALPPKLEPILTLPMKTCRVTEGWKYRRELEVHKTPAIHSAVDCQAKRGTPVRAAADGWAVASYHTSFLPDLYKGKKLGYGLGWFVEVMHPLQDRDVFTTYNHLDHLAEGIPFFEPSEKDGLFVPDVVYEPFRKVLAEGFRSGDKILKPVFVRRGQIIGYVGDSGLSWGYPESWKRARDYKTEISWDPAGPHLHFEVFTRNEKGLKALRWDPFGLYTTDEAYKSGKPGPNGLFILNKKGKPLFVK